jgi:hypothetical protein
MSVEFPGCRAGSRRRALGERDFGGTAQPARLVSINVCYTARDGRVALPLVRNHGHCELVSSSRLCNKLFNTIADILLPRNSVRVKYVFFRGLQMGVLRIFVDIVHKITIKRN